MRIGNRTCETPVQVSIAVPVGWFYKENFTLLAPDGEFNVILSSEPLDESITGEEYAHIQGELPEREFPGCSEFSYEDFALGDEGVAKLRVFEWMPPRRQFSRYPGAALLRLICEGDNANCHDIQREPRQDQVHCARRAPFYRCNRGSGS